MRGNIELWSGRVRHHENVPNAEPITLTPQEHALLQKINFGFANPGQRDTDPKGDAALELTRLLCARGAIPEIRRRYLTDPKLNIGGRGKSRLQVFGSSKGEEIFRDGNFLPYLKYFIFGPDLPSEFVERLRQVVEDAHGSRGILDKLRRVSRAEAFGGSRQRSRTLLKNFSSLALEIGQS